MRILHFVSFGTVENTPEGLPDQLMMSCHVISADPIGREIRPRKTSKGFLSRSDQPNIM